MSPEKVENRILHVWQGRYRFNRYGIASNSIYKVSLGRNTDNNAESATVGGIRWR